MPLYQLRVLVENMGPIEAEEQQALAVAVSSPYMKPEGRRRYLRLLDNLAHPWQPQPREPREVIEHDPQKAAEWFGAMGVRIKH